MFRKISTKIYTEIVHNNSNNMKKVIRVLPRRLIHCYKSSYNLGTSKLAYNNNPRKLHRNIFASTELPLPGALCP